MVLFEILAQLYSKTRRRMRSVRRSLPSGGVPEEETRREATADRVL